MPENRRRYHDLPDIVAFSYRDVAFENRFPVIEV